MAFNQILLHSQVHRVSVTSGLVRRAGRQRKEGEEEEKEEATT